MIDYALIVKAIHMYERMGYERIDVPWMVDGVEKLGIISGRFMFVKPCFHSNQMKVELFHFNPEDPRKELQQTLNDAKFVLKYLGIMTEAFLDQSKISLHSGDGTELGSYEFHQRLDLSWVYGVGVIEPCFSDVLEREFYNRCHRVTA